jgi:hypothetical protein
MAGLVVSVTNDNHQRGTNYPNDERCIPGYECYPSYDSKAQVKESIIRPVNNI